MSVNQDVNEILEDRGYYRHGLNADNEEVRIWLGDVDGEWELVLLEDKEPRRLSDGPKSRERKRRIHEDDIWERAEFKAAQAAGRIKIAEALEQARQDYFGFLTPAENDRIKTVITMIQRRAS